MAVAQGTTNTNAGQFGVQKLDQAKYISLYDLVNKPDNRDALIKTFGNQGITGFLQLVGAVKGQGVAEEVTYWEEERLHKKAEGAMTSGAYVPATGDVLRANDVVLLDGAVRAFYDGSKLVDLSDGTTISDFSSTTFPVIGNLYGQGTDQPTEFLESGIVKRTNPFMIMKEVYSVTGSQATNIGWIDLGGGDYRWYVKAEADQRQRFMDKREMMMLMGERSGVTGVTGSEGYFTAIEDRGLVQSGLINTIAEVDDIVKIFDKQGAASEYALYVNRAQDLAIDDMLAAGQLASGTAATTVGAAAFGSFNNSPETALNLGFRSFARGGYTFHKHDWKLLNDPTLLADSDFIGVGVPMSQVADAKTGEKAPALEMNFKQTNGYSREMEHWMIGSILGASNATKDNVEFHYRSEMNLVTRAANRHLLIKK
jgi:hypothetical protein